MLKKSKAYLALLLSVALVLSGMIFIPASAESGTNTSITAYTALDMGAYALTEILVRLDSPYVEFVKDAHAQDVSTEKTGNPSAELQDTAKNHILINGESIADIVGRTAWYNARVHVTQYGEYEQFDIYIFDNVFNTHIYDTNFTVEITEGAVDSSGNPITPRKVQYSKLSHTFSDYVAPATKVTGMSIIDSPESGLCQAMVYLDSDYTASFSELQSADNATGTPSAELLDSVASKILINGKTVAECMEGYQWYGAVRAYIGNYGGKESLTFYLYDSAFGGKMYNEDFTIEFLSGAIDGSGNGIEPCKYTHNADDHTFTLYVAPPTQVAEMAIADFSAYSLTSLYITLDSDATIDYVDFNSGSPNPANPPAYLIETLEAYMLINGRTIGSIRAAGGVIWASLLKNYAGHQMYELHVTDGTVGTSMYSTSFTFEILDGAVDADQNLIKPCKYLYNPTDHTFSVYEYTDINVTELAAVDMPDDEMTELAIVLDSNNGYSYGDLQSAADATGNPSTNLINTVADKLLINGSSVAEIVSQAGGDSIRVHLSNNGENDLFDIYLYDAAFGSHLYDTDFTVEIKEGASDSIGNPIIGGKWQYNAEDQSFGDYVPKTTVTDVSAIPQDSYNLSEIYVRLDSVYDTYYFAVNAAIADPVPPQSLIDTATSCILFNGQPISAATSAVYVHITNYGTKEQFDIYYYNDADGNRIIDKDFTLEIVSGATDSHGNPIIPVKYQWSAESSTFGSFGANTLVLMRRQLVTGVNNVTLDFNNDKTFDVRDLINYKKQLAA